MLVDKNLIFAKEPASSIPKMRIAVGIATVGRVEVLNAMLPLLEAQMRQPDKLYICPTQPGDVDLDAVSKLSFPVEIVYSRQGSCPQRNAILEAATDMDAVIFFDDDFFPASSYLAQAEQLLCNSPDVVLATGALIEDGIHGPGLDAAYAKDRVSGIEDPGNARAQTEPYYGVYGCNMLVRMAPVRDACIRFDEVLPLYGWQEDIDFSRQMAPFGKIVRSAALIGIHLGTKRGRTSGVRFGYSQIANPVYLMQKGTMSVRFGTRTMMRNVLANLFRSLRPEPHIDRAGRVIGNLKAVRDAVCGRLHPGRVLDL